METIKDLLKLDIPIMMGTNTHEGTVFVFMGFPGRMNKIVYQILVASFFRESALHVMKMYGPLARRVDRSSNPDYRVVLSQIIGDYLFRCPNQLFASKAAQLGTPVHLYEFALPTRTPGFPICDGMACHTAEIPYIFNHHDIIADLFTFLKPEISSMNSTVSDTASTTTTTGGGSVSHQSPSSPDLIGAAANWLTGQLRASKLNPAEKRLRLDFHVATLMSAYWTTFASYRDPNGQPSNNGVSAGTRPNDGDAPWWPRLLGELPSEKAMHEMQLSTMQRLATSTHSNDRRRQQLQPGSASQTFNSDESRPSDAAIDLIWDSSYRHLKEENNEPNFDEDFQLDSDYSPLGDTGEQSSGFGYSYETLIKGIPVFSTHTGQHSSMDLSEVVRGSIDSFPRNVRSNGNHGDSAMHIMKFREQTDVQIFEDDCICKAWNKMDYRF